MATFSAIYFKANFHTEIEPFFKKKLMLTMVDTLSLRLSA